jgi:uncharacterized surface protein with fasciclin (FAS1) repeats
VNARCFQAPVLSHVQEEPAQGNRVASFMEPTLGHVVANTVKEACAAPNVEVTTISEVLLPCATADIFPRNRGCHSVAEAVMQLEPGHPLAMLSYASNTSAIALLKHPNLLDRFSGGGGFTIFVPSTKALASAALTMESDPSVIEHVLRGHIIPQRVCSNGALPAGAIPTLATKSVCGALSKLTIARVGTNLQVSNGKGNMALTQATNIQICGGVLHEIDSVLMPCTLAEYRAVGSAAAVPQTAAAGAAPSLPKTPPSNLQGSSLRSESQSKTVGASNGGKHIAPFAAAALAFACASVL